MNQADILFTNALVLTMDDAFRQHQPGAVAVTGDKIVAVGAEAEIKKLWTGKETVDCQGRILMPGLINAHTHVPMTLLRGLADDLRLDVWLMGYMMPVEREFVSPDFVKLGTQLACYEMIRGGTTCFADMFYFEESVAQGAAEAGMRAICGSSVLKFPTPDAKFFEEALDSTRVFIKKWKGHPLIIPSVAPHAPYTTTPEIIKACSDMAVEFDVPLQIHLAETTNEVEGVRTETGMPVIPYMKKLGLFNAKVIAAHCVHVDEGEIRALHNSGVGVAHNPSSNLKLASGAAPVKKMLDLQVKVGIGTDGPASNNDLDMFEEMRLASFLAKLQTGDPTAVPARSVVFMATRGGAQALHIADLTGSLTVGKRADLILIDADPVHNMPAFQREKNSPYARLAYSAKASDVSATMVNGKWLMRDKKVLTLDEKTLVERSMDYARRIDIFLTKREKSVLSKLVAIGGAMEEESFEVQVKVRIPDPDVVIESVQKPGIQVEYLKQYRQFDTYFLFAGSSQGRLRYREDELIGEKEEIVSARARLTLIGQDPLYPMEEQVLLSRSRYLAPASNSLRFYREYFKPSSEVEVHKNRRRYHVRFQETDFYINIDQVTKPELGSFLEVKSRTWSKQDAEQKSRLVHELIRFLGATEDDIVTKDYLEIVLGL